jgi:outer membrane protein TolC
MVLMAGEALTREQVDADLRRQREEIARQQAVVDNLRGTLEAVRRRLEEAERNLAYLRGREESLAAVLELLGGPLPQAATAAPVPEKPS